MKNIISKKDLETFQKKANWLRRKILNMAVRAGAGHVAPSFSCVEILIAFYYCGFLRIDSKNPKWKDRDRFILSKGHAAIAAYAILADLDFFPLAELDSFTIDGSYLGGHAEDNIPGIEAFSGSLGHGLSICAGMALASKMDNKKHRIISLMGDGECHEGSVWEAAMFASNHNLGNLIAVIDHNGLCATDLLKNRLEVEPLEGKFKSFGWETIIVNGHSFNDLVPLLTKINSRTSSSPLAVIALTIKGKGVSFMENNPIWHYRIPVGEELNVAYQELSEY